jgi:hypothetical protein
MKKTKLSIEIDRLSGYDFYPFLDISQSIDWMLESRGKNKKLDSSINYNVILQCCTFIEGSICQLLESIIEYRELTIEDDNSKFKNYTLNILKETKLKIDESQWSNYPNIYESLLGYKLVSKIDNDLWKSIQILFNLRNAITHGNILTIEYDPIESSDECKIEVLGKYRKIYDYFSEKNLIKKDFAGFVDLMNDDIADFYAIKTTNFINAIISSIESPSEKFSVMNRFVFLKETTQDFE